ncbi:MAG: HAD hydrolase-like protein [Lachnospiraceae bacterium]|nr:HAD hydrolase-like protein [Lachnospiraceae bacterium]
MSWKYILFDLDGTITDSSEGIINCIIYALGKMGHDIPSYKELYRYIGPPLYKGFQEIAGMEYKEALEAAAIYREKYSVTGLFENKPYDGIEEVLKILKENGKVTGLATSKPEEYAIRILEHFNLAGYFDKITGGVPDGSRNDKEIIIEESISRFGLSGKDKPDIIMIGDRKYDIIGAKKCGIASAGVYYGFARKGELEEAGADYIIDTVSGITGLLL